MKTNIYARALDSAAGMDEQRELRLAVGTFKIVGWLGDLVSDIAAAVVVHHRRRVAIRELAALDDHMLRDIGIERNRIRDVVDAQIEENVGARRDRRAVPEAERYLAA